MASSAQLLRSFRKTEPRPAPPIFGLPAAIASVDSRYVCVCVCVCARARARAFSRSPMPPPRRRILLLVPECPTVAPLPRTSRQTSGLPSPEGSINVFPRTRAATPALKTAKAGAGKVGRRLFSRRIFALGEPPPPRRRSRASWLIAPSRLIRLWIFPGPRARPSSRESASMRCRRGCRRV
jgi:hypothetical protein